MAQVWGVHTMTHSRVGFTQGLAYRDREGARDVLGWATFDALEGGVLIVDDVLKETACKWTGVLLGQGAGDRL